MVTKNVLAAIFVQFTVLSLNASVLLAKLVFESGVQ